MSERVADGRKKIGFEELAEGGCGKKGVGRSEGTRDSSHVCSHLFLYSRMRRL